MHGETPVQWTDALSAPFAGRKVVCGPAPLAALADWVSALRAAGAQRPLLLATGTGAGRVPTPDEAEVVLLDTPPAASITEEVRRHDAVLRTGLSAPARAALKDYDPEHAAVWAVSPFVRNDPLHGRAVTGGRPEAWLLLEDKTVADAVWDAAGVARAPSAVVDLDPAELAAAGADLDAGDGVVWAGDASRGMNGAGEYVRWVVTPEERTTALAFFAGRCHRVRVMPFLEGVPCSVHGCVMPDGVAAFRPLELAILRGPGHRFVYGGQGSTWDPGPADRDVMRELVRRTGEVLRAQVGYRGFFGVDGVLTREGFRPTELNPRMSAGVVHLGRQVDPTLFLLLQLTAVAGHPPPMTARELEEWALPVMDRHRVCNPTAVVPRPLSAEPLDLPVAWDGDRLVRSEEETGWWVHAGPAPIGTFARLEPPAPEPGRRVADLNVALMGFLDAELAAGIGPVAAAPDVRVARP